MSVTKHGAKRSTMVITKGGRCLTCHRPEFLHFKGHFCLTREQAAPFDPLMEQWHAVIDPLRDTYKAARKQEKNLRSKLAHGKFHEKVTPERLSEAELRADTAWGVYQMTVRRMNRELGKEAALPDDAPVC